MFFEEFPPVADNRPTDSPQWFHQLVDLSSTVGGSGNGPVTVKLWSEVEDAERTLVLPSQRQPSWQS
jgi:hypothetical protein